MNTPSSKALSPLGRQNLFNHKLRYSISLRPNSFFRSKNILTTFATTWCFGRRDGYCNLYHTTCIISLQTNCFLKKWVQLQSMDNTFFISWSQVILGSKDLPSNIGITICQVILGSKNLATQQGLTSSGNDDRGAVYPELSSQIVNLSY